MTQRTQTWLIVSVVLVVVVVWGVASGQFADIADDLATIWDYVF